MTVEMIVCGLFVGALALFVVVKWVRWLREPVAQRPPWSSFDVYGNRIDYGP